MVLRYNRSAVPRRKVYKPRTKKQAIKRAVSSYKKSRLTKLIKQVMTKKVETKIANPYNVSNFAILPYDVTTNNFGVEVPITQIFTNITQGTGQGQRIGNRINVVSLSMKGYAVCQRTALSALNNANVYLKLLWVRRKSNLLNINSAPSNNFLQNGNSTTSPTNQPSDILRQINKDAYIVYTSRMFKLGFSDGGVTSGTTTTPQAPNNDFKVSKFFKVSLNKHVDKIIYDDGNASPTNWACSVVPLLCYADGTAIISTASPTIELNFDIECKYKDF